jgi:4-azaleucine resistance transporter AzlC
MRSLYRTLPRDDVRDLLALTAAVGVVGMSFGALAAAVGVSLPMAVAMSVLVLSGGSQFLAISVVAAGGGMLPAVVGGLLLGARHLPYGLAMAPVVGRSWPARLLGAHLLIDEVVAFSRARGPGPRGRAAYWACGVALVSFWTLGTVVGALAGAAVPDPEAFGIDAAFPAALFALLLPALRGRGRGEVRARRAAAAGSAVALAATPLLPAGLPVLAGLLGVAAAGKRPEAEPEGERP